MAIVLCAVLAMAAGAWLALRRRDRISELDPNCWAADPAERAAAVRMKSEAAARGAAFTSARLARRQVPGLPGAPPALQPVMPPLPPKLVREHPMRPPRAS